MKYFTAWMIAGVSVLALSGCSTGDDVPIGGTITEVDIHNLDNGYRIAGYDDGYAHPVEFDFCNGRYEYYRGENYSEFFSGTFDIVRDEVQMRDSDGGSYVIPTGTSSLEVGEEYNIYNLHRNILVSTITEITCR